MNFSLNRNQLKYLAIIAMVIDHIAWSFVPTMSLAAQIMHFVGRLTGPVMAYMVFEGYMHTRDVKKYAIRLFIFSLISWIPYSLHENGKWPTPSFSVITSLFLGLIAIWVWDKAELNKGFKVAIIVGLCMLSIFADWPIFDVLWPLFLFVYRDDPVRKWRSFSAIAIGESVMAVLACFFTGGSYGQVFQLGVLPVIPLLKYAYNGEPGNRNAFHKWFFYIFYPLHLLILALIEIFLVK